MSGGTGTGILDPSQNPIQQGLLPPASQSASQPVHSLSITAAMPSICHVPYSMLMLFMLIVSGHQGG